MSRDFASGIKIERYVYKDYTTAAEDYVTLCIPPGHKYWSDQQQYRYNENQQAFTESGEPVIQLGPHNGVTERGKEVYIP